MLRAKFSVLAIIPVLALTSCTGEDIDDGPIEDQEQVEQSIYADPAMQTLAGTYAATERTPGAIELLVLKTDGTYHAAVTIVCVRAPCDPLARDGKYTLSQRDRINYMTLWDPLGRSVEQYEYVLAGNTLRMRALLKGAPWRSLSRTNGAWCGVQTDCKLQNLPPGPCAGEWTCAYNACNYDCRHPETELTAASFDEGRCATE